MVDEFMNDDDQAEVLKRWWRENWIWMLAGIVLGLGLLFGWQYYQRYTAQRAETAGATLNQFAAALVTDKAKAAILLNDLTSKYKSTPYASQAQLLQAQNAVGNGDLVGAEAALRAVVASSKDEHLSQIATLRLARVLIELNKLDEALALLDVSKAGGFVAQTHEIRGDALLAKQDQTGAVAEYQSALNDYKNIANADVSLLELKLADLGVVPGEIAKDAVVETSAK